MSAGLIDIFRSAEDFLKDVSACLAEAIEDIDTPEAREFLDYALAQKGQMLRPSLVYFTAYAMRGQLETEKRKKLVRLACVIELIHTASLVHDDIIDDADERRGKPSLYRLNGTNNALLAGNIFYLKAFDIGNRYLDREQLNSIVRAASDMCCGEVIQQKYKDRIIPHDIYFEIISKKTSSLIKYACKESSRIAGASRDEEAEMQSLGENLGILYQLSDDFKDSDVSLEDGFLFKEHAKRYLSEAGKTIGKLPESTYKKTFNALLELIGSLFALSAVAE